jgi:hypothetical protein
MLINISCGGIELCESGETYKISGLNICDNGFDILPEDIEHTVSVLEQETNIRYPEISNLKRIFNNNNVTVTFTDAALATNCQQIEGTNNRVYACERSLGGFNENGNTLYVRYNDCLAYSSLSHELLHSIEFYYLDIKNGANHDTPFFFIRRDGVVEENLETIEFKTTSILVRTLEKCPLFGSPN